MTNLSLAEPTRWPNGISTNQDVENLGFYSLPDPTPWHTHFDDFNTFLASEWVDTLVGTGAFSLADADGGVLLLEAPADLDSVSMQRAGASFLFESGKRLFGRFRFKVSEVLDTVIVAGLSVLDTTPTSSTGAIYFISQAFSSGLNITVSNDGATQSSFCLDLVDDTYADMGFYYDGIDLIRVFSDGKLVTSVKIEGAFVPEGKLMTETYYLSSGSATAKALSIDDGFMAKKR